MSETKGFLIMACPFCQGKLSFAATDAKSCFGDANHHYFYISKTQFYLVYQGAQIGKDKAGYFLDIDLDGLDPVMEIPPFNMKDIKQTIEKYLSLKVFL